MENIAFRTATAEEMPRILQIIEQARRRMAAAGSQQWQDGYPASGNIANDLAHGYGYVICRSAAGPASGADRNGTVRQVAEPGGSPVVAYGAIVFDGEPAYDAIEGSWLSDRPYVVVHRLAVADEALGRHLGTEFLRHAERLALQRGVSSFRIDTNFDNHRMLRILTREGFTRCGTVGYRGSSREAFEKLLGESGDR